MKSFIQYLEGLANKTQAVFFILALYHSGLYLSLVPASWMPYVDFACVLALATFKAIAPTGVLTKGQTLFFWVSTGLGLIITFGQAFLETALFNINPELIGKVITFATGLLAFWQYINGVNLSNKVAALKLEQKLSPDVMAPDALPTLSDKIRAKYVIPKAVIRKYNLAA